MSQLERKIQNEHLDWLEAESIYIIREVIAQASRPAMLFSGGKDSIVMFHLARKAFRFGNRPIQLPFPLFITMPAGVFKTILLVSSIINP